MGYEAFEKMMQKISEAAKTSRALGPGLKVGKFFKMSVADGYAGYVVTKVTKSTATIKWLESPDGYTDRILGKGGSFPKSIIEPLVLHEDKMAALFSR